MTVDDVAWSRLVVALEARLEATRHSDVSGSLQAGPYYAQWSGRGMNGALHVEVVSNTYLPPAAQYDGTALAMLRRFGWEEPGEAPNHHLRVATDAPSRPAVCAVHDVMRHVWRTSAPDAQRIADELESA